MFKGTENTISEATTTREYEGKANRGSGNLWIDAPSQTDGSASTGRREKEGTGCKPWPRERKGFQRGQQ